MIKFKAFIHSAYSTNLLWEDRGFVFEHLFRSKSDQLNFMLSRNLCSKMSLGMLIELDAFFGGQSHLLAASSVTMQGFAAILFAKKGKRGWWRPTGSFTCTFVDAKLWALSTIFIISWKISSTLLQGLIGQSVVVYERCASSVWIQFQYPGTVATILYITSNCLLARQFKQNETFPRNLNPKRI